MRDARVRKVTIEFEDGAIESWSFPAEAPAFYRSRPNMHAPTGSAVPTETWDEHRLTWTSDRKVLDKAARREFSKRMDS